jgi:hypothetical protein
VTHHEFGLGRGNELCDVKAALIFSRNSAPSLKAMTPISVSIRSTQFKAVKGRVHFLRILGASARE